MEFNALDHEFLRNNEKKKNEKIKFVKKFNNLLEIESF